MTSLTNAGQGTLLAIDTSTSSMSVALTRGGELIGELSSKADRNHSIHLIPHIQQVLSGAGIHPRELDAFAVGVGPGSYTGVRIGVTAAKTFAWTHGMALLGVSSLEALAVGGGEAFLGAAGEAAVAGDSVTDKLSRQAERIWIVPMFEARRGQAFTALYEASPQGWQCLAEDGIRVVSLWAEELLERAMHGKDGAAPDRILVTGETGLHEQSIGRLFAGWPGTAAVIDHEMRARHIAEIGRRHWQQGRTESVHLLVPNYTQMTEAEAKLLTNKT
jgi:tRNA threonylcarbamoyladenosine biosynthesis protein TsaB